MSDLPSAAERFGPYDERAMIRYTIFKYPQNLFTRHESQAAWRITLWNQRPMQNPERLAWIEALTSPHDWSDEDNAAVDALLADGVDGFADRVIDRILSEYPERLTLNRCPVCQRIVLTPTAKWCMWCHHDWH